MIYTEKNVKNNTYELFDCGDGNVRRPVERLHYYLEKYTITELKEISEFKPICQTWLHKKYS